VYHDSWSVGHHFSHYFIIDCYSILKLSVKSVVFGEMLIGLKIKDFLMFLMFRLLFIFFNVILVACKPLFECS